MSSAPLRIELYDPERHPDLLLRSPREIAFLLRSLAERRVQLGIFAERRHLFTSVLLDVTEEHLVLDPCGDEQLNRLATQWGVICQGKLEGVTVQFACARLVRVEHQGVMGLGAPLPSTVLRLQRREFFRLPPPVPTWWCELPWSDPAFAPLQAEEPKLKLRVLDLSVGGVALFFPPEVPAPAHGHQFAGARLILPPMDWLETAMEVRSILPLDTPGPARAVHTRVGFRFIGMPTAAANRLYRFLFELQREQLAARRGT